MILIGGLIEGPQILIGGLKEGLKEGPQILIGNPITYFLSLHTFSAYTLNYIFLSFVDAIQREVSLLEDKFAEIEEALFVEMYMSKRDITTSDSYQMILNKIQDGAWLSTCWSFHDCCLFEKLVDNFGSDDLKKRAKNYSYEITEFCRNTVLSDFAIFSIAVGRNLPEKEFKDFIIELGRCEKFTLEELYKLVETINVGFSLPMHTLILKNVSPESDGLTVTWAIHAALVTSEKRSWTWSACTRSLYKRRHIKSIIIDDYRISRHQNPSYSKYRSGKNSYCYVTTMC